MTRMATGWCAVAVTSMGPRLWWGGSRVMTVVSAVAKEAAKVVWRWKIINANFFILGLWHGVGLVQGRGQHLLKGLNNDQRVGNTVRGMFAKLMNFGHCVEAVAVDSRAALTR